MIDVFANVFLSRLNDVSSEYIDTFLNENLLTLFNNFIPHPLVKNREEHLIPPLSHLTMSPLKILPNFYGYFIIREWRIAASSASVDCFSIVNTRYMKRL